MTLYFPPGTYIVTGNAIELWSSQTRLLGAGKFQSIIKASASRGPLEGMIQQGGNATQRFIELGALGFDGGQVAYEGIALPGTVISSVKVRDCLFSGMPNAIGAA